VKLLFGLLIMGFAMFQLYLRVEKIHTAHVRQERAQEQGQHATFETASR
jgi:hypothetical protein